MTLSLAAVFIPVLFMGGIIGRLLHEFSVVIMAAILVSGFVSLTLTPMLCSRFLRSQHEQKHGRLYMALERFFDRLLKRYDSFLAVVAAPSRYRSGCFRRNPGDHRLAILCDSQGILARGRYFADLCLYRSRAGHLVRRHGAAPERARRRSFSTIPIAPISSRA